MPRSPQDLPRPSCAAAAGTWAAALPHRRRDDPLRFLTRRERQVLGLLCAGCTTGEIVQRLGVSTGCARNYVQAVLDKLGARSRAQAIAVVASRREP